MFSITLIPFKIFLWYLVYIYILRQADVLSVRLVPPPCYPFELSPSNEFYKGKLASSIIVIIPYLLAVALCLSII